MPRRAPRRPPGRGGGGERARPRLRRSRNASAEGALDLVEEALVRLVGPLVGVPVEFLEQAPLLVGQMARDDDVHEHALVAASVPVKHGHAFAAEHHDRAGLRPRVELELLVAVEGRDLDRRAECGLGHRQVDGRVDVVALAHEAWVGSHVDAHVCVPCARAEDAGVPLAGEADLLAVVDAGWNLDVQPALFDDAAGALADRAWRLDAPARASARRARLRANELPEDAARDLLQAAGTATRRTGRDLAARLCAVAAAALASHRDAERNLADGAAGRLDEFDLDVGAEIRAARPHARSEEIVSEERGEEVGEVAEVEVSRLEAAAAQPGVPVAIVELARLRLRQHLVGLDD